LSDVDDYVGNLLAALVSLRTFEIVFDKDNRLIKGGLSFIEKVSDRAPHLEHFNLNSHCYKRVGGEWVICNLRGPFCSHSKGECVLTVSQAPFVPAELASRVFFEIADHFWFWN
jgi:hypothetical protein